MVILDNLLNSKCKRIILFLRIFVKEKLNLVTLMNIIANCLFIIMKVLEEMNFSSLMNVATKKHFMDLRVSDLTVNGMKPLIILKATLLFVSYMYMDNIQM